MVLTILTAKQFKTDKWKEKLIKYTNEQIKLHSPDVVRVNHFNELFCSGVNYKLDLAMSNNIEESDYVVILRDKINEDEELEKLVTIIQGKDIVIKNFKI